MIYNFDSLVSVSGKSGLFHLIANRPNGLILEDITSKQKSFYSTRLNQFTPLASIGIYTDDDSIALKVVFNRIKDNEDGLPVANEQDVSLLIAYFEKILPEYDRDRVKIADIRKVYKWYHFIKSNGLISLLEEEVKEEVAASPEANTES
jgi:Domain of unknown function (DUF5606)